MSTDPLSRLRALNPVPETLAPPPLGPLLQRIETGDASVPLDADEPLAKGTTAGADRWRRRRRPDSALVAVGLSVLVVVAIFVGALALLHDRGAPRETSSPASPATSSQRELLRTLGVLRTAPTAADRALTACIERALARTPADAPVPLWRDCPGADPLVQIVERPNLVPASALSHGGSGPGTVFASMGYPRPDLALIRSVPWAGAAYRITIFPASFRSSRPSAPRTWGVFVHLVPDNNNREAIDPFPTSVGRLRAHGIAVFGPGGGPPPGARLTGFTVHPGVIIVPDGVAKVTVETVITTGCKSTAFLSCSGRSVWRVRENVTAAVHDNVATVPLRTPTYIGGLPPSDPGGVPKNFRSFGFDDGSTTLRMTWLDAHGKVIKHTTATNVTADGGQGPAL